MSNGKKDPARLTRVQIRTVLDRHLGSKAAIAKALGLTSSSISRWLMGQSTSRRVENACREAAERYLAAEREAERLKEEEESSRQLPAA